MLSLNPMDDVKSSPKCNSLEPVRIQNLGHVHRNFCQFCRWRRMAEPGIKKKTLIIISQSMDNRLRHRELTHRLWAGTTVTTALCLHSTTLLMSIPSPKAQWNDQEVHKLLD